MIDSFLEEVKNALGIYWTPGVAAAGIGATYAWRKGAPTIIAIVHFLQGRETKREERIAREAQDRIQEIQELRAESLGAMQHLKDENARYITLIDRAEAQEQEALKREQQQRTLADRERRLSIWHYGLAIAWWRKCHAQLSAWKEGQPPPTEDLPPFESLGGERPPD